MDSRLMRDVFGAFATGVTVVTCASGDEAEAAPHGATVTAFTPISLDPPLCQVAMTRTSKACQFLDGRSFAVNILAQDQVDEAWHFAGRPTYPAPAVVDGPAAPVLERAAATISCRPWATYDGGDHLIFIGEVVDVNLGDEAPLLFHRSSFKSLGPRLHASAWLGCSDDPSTGWFDAETVFMPLTRPLSSTPA
ncbi:flavin reductase [Nocardioides immobilis]|uniref:Flavin reductase n=1 Tax=Nocardioides immobilis TaxID=2049295 RepID=A0A417Y0S9_9ACTN|nr:flavin reductase family protein [Nocardioides immobilis]RHW26174.1 flavin reductase [Nocardioides immobilis]